MNKPLDNLNKDGTFYKFNGIVQCVKSNMLTDEVVARLRELKTDNSQIAGHSISDFSIAALDVMGIEKYYGDDSDIICLINSKFTFV